MRGGGGKGLGRSIVRTKSMMFAAIALAASAMGLVCGCTKAPSHVRVAPAVAPASVGFASERWPTEAEAAAWTITRDEAMRIGRERVELPSDSHMIYHSSPVVRDG